MSLYGVASFRPLCPCEDVNASQLFALKLSACRSPLKAFVFSSLPPPSLLFTSFFFPSQKHEIGLRSISMRDSLNLTRRKQKGSRKTPNRKKKKKNGDWARSVFSFSFLGQPESRTRKPLTVAAYGLMFCGVATVVCTPNISSCLKHNNFNMFSFIFLIFFLSANAICADDGDRETIVQHSGILPYVHQNKEKVSPPFIFFLSSTYYRNSMHMELITAKLASSTALTVASLIGLVAPFLCFSLCCKPSAAGAAAQANSADHRDAQHHHASPSIPHYSTGSERGGTLISFANCVSAGILLWTGLMHFFFEGAEGFVSLETAAGAPSGSALEGGLFRALCWCIGGMLLPLAVERIVWPWVTDWAQHGVSSKLASSSLVNQAQPSPGSSFAAQLLVSHHTHGHSHGSNHSSDSHQHELEAPSPATSGWGGAAPPVSVGSAAGADPKVVVSKDITAAILIAVLMSVHSATEGVAIGVEQTPAAVRQSTAPLFVHKIFDGWLVGLGVYRTVDVAVRAATLPGVLRHLLTRSSQRYALWIWLAALPAMLMVVGVLSSPAEPHAVSEEAPTTLPSGAAAHSATGHHASHGPPSFAVAAAQAASSGSFLYISLCAILMEELSPSVPYDDGQRARRNAVLLSGAFAGLLLGSILAAGDG